MMRIIAAWPNRPWLNFIVFITFFFSLVQYYLGPGDLTKPFPLFVGSLWLMMAAGRVLVLVMDTIRERRRTRHRPTIRPTSDETVGDR